MKTIEEYLRYHATNTPDAPAIMEATGGVAMTYAQLWQQVEQRAEELRTQTTKRLNDQTTKEERGKVVPLRTTQTTDFVVTYFAIHHIGCVAMPLDHDMPEDRFQAIATRYESFTPPTEVADILFTTGTTGQSKGVMISHDAILADTENLIDAHQFHAGLTFIVCGPLNHIGSLSKLWPVIHQGASLCILPGLKDINLFFKAMEGKQHIATFLVPANVRMLLQFAPRQLAECADRIEFIENGAAAMPHADMLALCKLLPNTRLYNTYASTETGIICTYNYNDGRTLPQCLGHPMLHAQVSITPDGHIECSGRTLMTGYADIQNSKFKVQSSKFKVQSSKASKIESITTADLGYIDDEGMLHLTGRADDVINVGGYKVAPTEVEDAALTHPAVADCICIAVPSPITGNALKLLVVTAPEQSFSPRQLAQYLSKHLERHKVPLLYQQVETIRRTFNGKIDRKYYRKE